MEYSVKIYSRIGELMQGFLPDASTFLVSGLPSRIFFSEAVLDPRGVPNVVPKGKTCQGALPPKARKALALFLQEFAPVITPGLSIRLNSNIPAGKGLSSSSADILSVLYVVNDYLRTHARPEDMYRIAAAIEPTDPCLSEDIVLFRQRLGVVDRYLSLPPMSVLYFDADPSREIETMHVRRQFSNGVGTFFGWLLKRFLGATEAGDYVRLFDCVSYSAEYNQREIAIPRFGEWLGLAKETESGLMVAHSGTIAGLLTRPERAAELRSRLEAAVETPVYFEEYRHS